MRSRRVLVNINSPSSSGESKDDKMCGDTVPVDEITEKDDFFQTQVVDYFDDDDLTQPVDFNEETQIMDIAGETQVMDDFEDFDGDTQVLIVSDSETECESDGDVVCRTQVLDDTVHLNDIRVPDSIDNQTDEGKTIISPDCQDDGEGRAESRPSSDVTPRSDHLRKGFTSVRTASLRAAGAAARKMASKKGDDGSFSATFGSESSKCHSVNNDRIHTGREVNPDNNMAEHDENGLGNDSKSVVARSLARKLFMEEDFAEGSDEEPDFGMAELSQLPGCHNDFAGLSYVDSQEPGELSQANALQFVDKFLKVNLLEPDEVVVHKRTVCETTPSPFIKGANSIARDTNHRSRVASASVYEWDDKLEDEGGGEFFIKKRDLLLGNRSVSRKSCNKTRTSEAKVSQLPGRTPNIEQQNTHHDIMGIHSDSKLMRGKKARTSEAKVSQLPGRTTNVEQQNTHHNIMGIHSDSKLTRSKKARTSEAKVSQLPGRSTNVEQQNTHHDIMGIHSDSKLTRGKKAGKFDKIVVENNDKSCTDLRSHIDGCDRLASDAPSNAEAAEFLDVGIDTQMAAEAMEALSTATALLENSNSMADEGPDNVPKKRHSARKRSCTSNPGIGTRSQQKSDLECKHSLALRTRSKSPPKEVKVDLVEPRLKQRRSSKKNTSNDNKKETSDRELCDIVRIGAENNLEGELHINQSGAVKRRSLRKKETTLGSVEKNTKLISLNHLNGDSGTSDDSKKQRRVEGVHTRKRKAQGDVASANPNTGVQTLNPTNAGASCMLDGSSDKGRELLVTCGKDTGSANNGDVAPKFAFGKIERRTRSKRSPQSAHCPKDGKRVHPHAIVSPESVLKSCLGKQHECSSPAKEILPDVALGGLYGPVPESSSYPTNITPNNLKTPEHVVSPICMGDEYRTPSCKKNLFLKKECYKLTESEDLCSSPFRVLRQRRDINNVRVLFSQHLDGDIVKQQKKILSRLGFYEASSILEATHFIADTFTRTRNMLEAIANAKLVVTHLWLESCGQANCFIDEKMYILRDTKKEKELGFNMPMSLARASRHPILEGRRVLLTPSIKPSKDIISSLVKAVHGQALERLCRSSSNNEKLLDDLLVLSCEEDFEVCLPLLEKGISVYSSELLLNGIITQRLEYERHRLFVSHVKKTRSTVWLKKEGDKFCRVQRAS